MNTASAIDPGIADFIVVSEVDQGPAFAEQIFQRKYKLSVPHFPHHVMAFFKKADDHFVPASYLHVNPHGEIYLIGGGCTDGRAFGHMSAEQQQAVNAAGGLLLQTLRYSFARFASRCEAFFGHCGDERAFAVDMQAGFQPTEHKNLLVHWHKLLNEEQRQGLLAKAHAIGPF